MLAGGKIYISLCFPLTQSNYNYDDYSVVPGDVEASVQGGGGVTGGQRYHLPAT